MNKEFSVEIWERTFTADVLKGPSADRPEINRLCYHAWREGLILDGKFSFVREVAEIMYHAQPDGQPARPLEELNLEFVATRFNRPPDRVRTIAELMVQHSLLPSATIKTA